MRLVEPSQNACHRSRFPFSHQLHIYKSAPLLELGYAGFLASPQTAENPMRKRNSPEIDRWAFGSSKSGRATPQEIALIYCKLLI
jgi:hypothetical protein